MKTYDYTFDFKFPEYIPPTQEDLQNSKRVVKSKGLPGFKYEQSGPYSPAPLSLDNMLQLFDDGIFVGGTATMHEFNFAHYGATTLHSPEKVKKAGTGLFNRNNYGVNPDGSLHKKIQKVITQPMPGFDVKFLQDLKYPIAFVCGAFSIPSLSETAKKGQSIMSVEGTAKGFLVVHKDAFYEGACILRTYTPDIRDFDVYPVITRTDEKYSLGVYEGYKLPVNDLLYKLPVYIHLYDKEKYMQNPTYKNTVANQAMTFDIVTAHNEALPRISKG